VIDADRPLQEVTADLIVQVDRLLAGHTRP
jgi:hypothetical protein